MHEIPDLAADLPLPGGKAVQVGIDPGILDVRHLPVTSCASSRPNHLFPTTVRVMGSLFVQAARREAR